MFHFGVDYYPEHWPAERWDEDARLMADAGVNLVRLGEFAWALLEPGPDHFDFTWLDRALETLHKHGIQAILGTPTASPPAWLMAWMPDAYRVVADGRRLTYGCRREYCPSHRGYRQRGGLVTRAMAEHYADHPAVIGWQIDNELSGSCYCPTCQAYFQAWLQKKYGGLEKLNAAWGTAFWSHVYTAWSQIPAPLESGAVHNPGLQLDYWRFISSTYADFQQEQVKVLRAACPNHFITHNFMGFGFDELDYYDLARDLDWVAWDNYPRLAWQLEPHPDPASLALGHATMRGLKGKPFWLMEQQSGSGGWTTVAMTPRPGEMRLWTYQAIAHGADGLLYFRWRTARHGTEQYWHGILDHHGEPRRRYQELQVIGSELAHAGEQILGAENRSPVAMLLSYDTRWAFHIQPNHVHFNYNAFFTSYYKALHSRNISVDILPPEADLSHYPLVIAPALHVLSQPEADNLRAYVENGGMLLVTARTGVKDENNAVVNLPLPGLLAEVCGVEVEEYDPLPLEANIALQFNWPGAQPAKASLWCDILNPGSAQTVARYQDEYYAGRAAITLNHFGKGQAVYAGTLGDEQLADTLVAWLIELCQIKPVLATPTGVEAIERWQGQQQLLFILNHSDREQVINLPVGCKDLLSGRNLQEAEQIAPRDVWIVVKPT